MTPRLNHAILRLLPSCLPGQSRRTRRAVAVPCYHQELKIEPTMPLPLPLNLPPRSTTRLSSSPSTDSLDTWQ
jgi:hypothetical protein